MADKVSIVITTFGGKPCIERAVQSCLAQTYKNIEVIVVDDSGLGTESQKKTESILKPYIDSSKILYVPHTTNRNASAARNTGVRESTGEFISLLDDDDVYETEKIEHQIEAFHKLGSDYGVVYCSMRDFVDGKIYEYKATTQGDALYEFLMMRVAACTSNIMIRRTLYERLGGFDETFKRHQDWEFLARAARVSKFFGISYVGTTKYTKNIVKRYSASQAEEFRFYYIEMIKGIINTLPVKQQRTILAHEYNEIAKLFLREKNASKMLYYIGLAGKPGMFLNDLLKKPFKAFKEKRSLQRNGKVIYIR